MKPREIVSRFLRPILDTITEGVMLVRQGGTILFVNYAMEVLTGYSREELVGKTCQLLDFDCCPTGHETTQGGACPLFGERVMVGEQCSLKRKDGTRMTAVLKNAQVLRDDDGNVMCAVEVQSDVTTLEEREREMTLLLDIFKDRQGFHGIIGVSPQMQNLCDLIHKAAGSQAPVLIYGESGTGKELVATVIHKLGKNNKGPFIRMNCAALSESLLESELFGHVKGAFTGANQTRKGRFEAAHTGDIFLDEVGDLPLSTQIKLLRVIQEKELERVGDYTPVPIDVRVMAATHRDLKALMKRGLFREDLFYRLNVIPIYIPPLKDRVGDLPVLLDHFIREASARTGKRIRGVDREAMELLTQYPWPGNVRELINVVEYAFVVCTGEVITREHLPPMEPVAAVVNPTPHEDGTSEKDRLTDALILAKGRKTEAARLLGVSRQTVWTWIKKHGLEGADFSGRWRDDGRPRNSLSTANRSVLGSENS